jgi:hypothetical protein
MINVLYYVLVGLVFGMGWLIDCNIKLKRAKAKGMDYLSMPSARRNRMLTVVTWIVAWPLIIAVIIIALPFVLPMYFKGKKLLKKIANHENLEDFTW